MKERFSDYGIDVGTRMNGTVKVKCPKCPTIRPYSHSSSAKSKDLSVNISEGVWLCHRCEWKGNLKEIRPDKVMKTFKKPVWKNNTNLSEKLVKWFESRKISQNTLRLMKITEGLEYMPQVSKEQNTTQFNYFRDGELVNVKYRDGAKNFKLVSGAELIFYNLDAIKDTTECIIVEGEIDCLSYYEANIQNCVSVPNGANKASNNLDYIENCFDYFEKKEKIYIATDNDSPGIKLRQELIIRLGSERCFIVDFKDCKDANEYLIKYGHEELRNTIKTAKECKIDGVLQLIDFEDELDNLYLNGLTRGNTLGFDELDEHISWVTGALAIITGIPGHGKSEFIDEICVRLNLRYGWKGVYFSPENFPVSTHTSKIISKITGKAFNGDELTPEDYMNAKIHIQDNFEFIYPSDEDFTLENILDKARYLVKKRGVKMLVIDPWNRLEHQIQRGENETSYISKQLDKITNFAQRNDVLIFLMAHPRKMEKKNGIFEVPTLYDISGSANFFNKAFYGLTVYRHYSDDNPHVTINIQKVKFKHLGKLGEIDFKYEFKSGRFIPMSGQPMPLDNFLEIVPDDQMPF